MEEDTFQASCALYWREAPVVSRGLTGKGTLESVADAKAFILETAVDPLNGVETPHGLWLPSLVSRLPAWMKPPPPKGSSD
ncbi:uncharacterized protein sS8_2295 [Methylocaldum marinum]|uniref:Uncharacterized protein n=1 Tax=Methylocaldum marinum TaxID=1432792 RepID=A0A250KRN0_9GAMM|nr:uncharacterized protein sS8_2295 [Methylocaldum marinum]